VGRFDWVLGSNDLPGYQEIPFPPESVHGRDGHERMSIKTHILEWRNFGGDPEIRRAVRGYFVRLVFLIALAYLIAKAFTTVPVCRRVSKYPNTLQHDINSEWNCEDEPNSSKNQ
jgi:hypothetical protein